MRILKVYPAADIGRFNYRVNYGVWDAIDGDGVMLERLKAKKLDGYDVVFLPQYKRFKGNEDILKAIKDHKVKKVLFDNDSCYRLFADEFYKGMDFVFYRCPDRDNKTPRTASSLLMWSIDTDVYTPRYKGRGVLFSCTVKSYPLREQIGEVIQRTREKGADYIKAIQDSAAAIHTDSPKVRAVRAKILEFAACGTQIISNRTGNMDMYFPDELITYFDTVDELKGIVKDFTPDVKVQKELRRITETKHSDKIRAKWTLETLLEKL